MQQQGEANPPAGGARAITLDELVALNQEIALLVRAGVPLEAGLAMLGEDLPGRLGRLTTKVAERMGRGETLADAVSEEGKSWPQVYRAVVEAGMRSGRLAAALEGITATARRVAEMRRVAGTALVYPIFVVVLAVFLFWLYVARLSIDLYWADAAGGTFASMMTGLRATAHVWGPLVPALIVLAAIVWWVASARAGFAARRSWPLAWIPSVRKLINYGCAATFAEILALLGEHEVPLHDAVGLAATASGDARIGRAGCQIAASLEQGRPLMLAAVEVKNLPEGLGWLRCVGGTQAALTRSARNAAETFRRRAEYQADWVRLMLPVLLTVTVGAGATLAFALAMFVPWTRLMHDLATL